MRQEVNDALLDKISKLLNMTVENGCTPAEAESAARRVQELLTKYNIDMAAVQMKTQKANDKDRVTEVRDNVINVPGNRDYRWAVTVATAVEKITFTKFLYYKNTRTGMLVVFWIGEPTDIAVARMLFHWLIDQGWALAKIHWHKRDKTKPASYLPWETSWIKGYAHGVWNMAEEVKKERETVESVVGLVLWKGGAVEAFYHDKYIQPYQSKEDTTPAKSIKVKKYRPRKEKPDNTNWDAYYDGKAKGETMPNYKPEELAK